MAWPLGRLRATVGWEIEMRSIASGRVCTSGTTRSNHSRPLLSVEPSCAGVGIPTRSSTSHRLLRPTSSGCAIPSPKGCLTARDIAKLPIRPSHAWMRGCSSARPYEEEEAGDIYLFSSAGFRSSQISSVSTYYPNWQDYCGRNSCMASTHQHS